MLEINQNRVSFNQVINKPTVFRFRWRPDFEKMARSSQKVVKMSANRARGSYECGEPEFKVMAWMSYGCKMSGRIARAVWSPY